MRYQQSRCAFTLIELLVVISIITLIISLLLPTISKTREQANRTVCLSNVRQLAVAAIMYSNEYKGIFPIEPQRLLLAQDYLFLDTFRADMYTLMKFGTKNVPPTTLRPDRVWQCPSNPPNWLVTTAPAGFTPTGYSPNVDIIRTSYMYLGAGTTLKAGTLNSWEADPTRRPHRFGVKGFSRVLFADEISYTTVLAPPLLSTVDIAGWRINHPPKGGMYKTVSGFQQGYAAGSSESYTDGHAEWATFPSSGLKYGRPNVVLPLLLGNGTANAIQFDSTTNTLSAESWWW